MPFPDVDDVVGDGSAEDGHVAEGDGPPVVYSCYYVAVVYSCYLHSCCMLRFTCYDQGMQGGAQGDAGEMQGYIAWS